MPTEWLRRPRVAGCSGGPRRPATGIGRRLWGGAWCGSSAAVRETGALVRVLSMVRTCATRLRRPGCARVEGQAVAQRFQAPSPATAAFSVVGCGWLWLVLWPASRHVHPLRPLLDAPP